MKRMDNDDMNDAVEGADYSVAMELADWLIIDAVMDDELQVIAAEGWDYDDWGEPTRDPHWAELSELGHSVRKAGWDQISDWPHEVESVRRWAAEHAGRTEAMNLTGRQWGLVVFALESRAALEIPDGVRAEYIELLKATSAGRRRVAALVRRSLAENGLEQVPVVRTTAN